MKDKTEKKKLEQVKKNPVQYLKMWNKLCRHCRLKSIHAVKRKDTKNIISKYCPKCKKLFEQ